MKRINSLLILKMNKFWLKDMPKEWAKWVKKVKNGNKVLESIIEENLRKQRGIQKGNRFGINKNWWVNTSKWIVLEDINQWETNKMRILKIKYICLKVKTWCILIVTIILLPGGSLKAERKSLINFIFTKIRK